MTCHNLTGHLRKIDLYTMLGNRGLLRIVEVSDRLAVNLPDCSKFCCENSENGVKEGSAKPLISGYFGK